MLDFVRKHATSWIIKVALFFIVIVFIFWGGYAYQARRKSHLARVGDTFITWKDYNRAYEHLVEAYRRQLKDNFSEDVIKKYDLKHKALEFLIEQVVLLQKARELGIKVSSAELQETIMSFPAFQTNGAFDPRRYRFVLMQNKLTPEAFEYQLRQSLILQKLENFVKRQAVVPEDEIVDYVRALKREKKFDYVLFKTADFENSVELSEDSLRKYYESHKDAYKEPESRQIAYVVFPLEAFEKDVHVSEQELKDYYNDHYNEYNVEKKVHARHILFRVPVGASNEEVKKIRKKAEGVLQKARAGEDFVALAKKYSEGPSAKNGGDLGWFSEKDMVPEFSRAVFSLKPGEISDLVRSDYGFHIVKVEEVKPGYHKPFEEVKEEIRKKIVEQKARDIAFEKARDFVDVAFASRDVVKAADVKGYKVKLPDNWFHRSDSVPGISESQKLMDAIFSLPEKGITDVIETKEGFVVAQVRAVRPERKLSFEEAKGKVEKDFRKSEAEALAKKRAELLLDLARKEGSLKKAAELQNMELKESQPISRMKMDFSLGVFGDALDEMLMLSDRNPFPEHPINSFLGFVVCQWKETVEPTNEAITAEVKRLKPMIQAQLAQQYWEGWKKIQRQRADVEILQKI
ncbi:MAG: SurA N-terminal domain-containing protein [Deltaproteobacteria bacterium]|nr:SurA N-terminal domain-containing protein [Deltaproteobacteria bacterium]